jgi:hypothetical protein
LQRIIIATGYTIRVAAFCLIITGGPDGSPNLWGAIPSIGLLRRGRKLDRIPK